MIIVRISGGLGNQMFQYALGRHLSHIHGTLLKFDISGFKSGNLRRYALGCFKIDAEIASSQEVDILTASQPGIVDRLFHNKPKPAKSHIVEGKSFQFKPNILKTPDNIYLDGYWQSEKYFKGITEIIRKEVSIKTEQTGRNREVADLISSVNAVSLHIRRGDYVSNPKTQQSHGNCSVDYYLRCIDELTQMIKEPHFFIFSDEPQWARENLKLDYPVTVLDHNGEDQAYEDLRLMTQCKSHIVANSSFSWWGAWLNPNKNKIVFAPKQWFAHKKWSDRDVVPDGWIRK